MITKSGKLSDPGEAKFLHFFKHFKSNSGVKLTFGSWKSVAFGISRISLADSCVNTGAYAPAIS